MTPAPSSFVARHRDAFVAVTLALASFVLYLLTLCPTVHWYDSAEYAGAAYTLGIPHPPGYPLYTLLAALFARLPFEPAYSVNLMSAVFAALAVALAYLVLRRATLGAAAAAVGAATLATSRLFWSQAVIAEVYTTTLALLLLILLLLLRGLREDRARWVFLAAFVAGLGLGVHLSLATYGLGLAVLVFGLGLPIRRPRDLLRLFTRERLGRRLAVAAGCLLFVALGACIFLYLPIRSAMRPELMMVDASTWEGFWWLVRGGNYVNWFLRDYAFFDRLGLVAGVLYDQLLVGGGLLAAAGVVFAVVRAPLFGAALALAAAGNLWFFFNYNVHDVEVFFLPAVLALCLFAGAGAEALFDAVARALARSPGAEPARVRRVAIAVRVFAFVLPLSLLLANYAANDFSRDTSAREFGEKVSRELPRGAVLVNMTTPMEWRKDAVFAKYFQPVLKQRLDVKVLAAPSPREVFEHVVRGTPTYAYEPESRLVRGFVLVPEGELYRIVRPRSMPTPRSR